MFPKISIVLHWFVSCCFFTTQSDDMALNWSRFVLLYILMKHWGNRGMCCTKYCTLLVGASRQLSLFTAHYAEACSAFFFFLPPCNLSVSCVSSCHHQQSASIELCIISRDSQCLFLSFLYFYCLLHYDGNIYHKPQNLEQCKLNVHNYIKKNIHNFYFYLHWWRNKNKSCASFTCFFSHDNSLVCFFFFFFIYKLTPFLYFIIMLNQLYGFEILLFK